MDYVRIVASVVNELEMGLVRRKTEIKSRTGQAPPSLYSSSAL